MDDVDPREYCDRGSDGWAGHDWPPFRESPSVPAGQVHIRRGLTTVGRIVNLGLPLPGTDPIAEANRHFSEVMAQSTERAIEATLAVMTVELPDGQRALRPFLTHPSTWLEGHE